MTPKPHIPCKNCGAEFRRYSTLDKYCPKCKVRNVKPIKKVSKKGLKTIKADETFYAKVLESRVKNGILVCDECGVEMQAEFQSFDGDKKKWRFSHRVTKGSRPDLRHDINNVNCLCFKHHQQWETGDRAKMRIYNEIKK